MVNGDSTWSSGDIQLNNNAVMKISTGATLTITDGTAILIGSNGGKLVNNGKLVKNSATGGTTEIFVPVESKRSGGKAARSRSRRAL